MIATAILRWAEARQPDFVIGGHERPYLLRWWLLPRNPVFNIYVHQFRRSDDDRALHDHSWLFNISRLLDGQYLEHTPDGPFLRRAGDWKFRWWPAPHRVELDSAPVGDAVAYAPVWTVFITGPRVRQWGFHCPQGWVHWKLFTSSDGNDVGRGCDQ